MMASLEAFLLWFGMGGTIFAWILYVIFGQVTVRKLRKNENTQGKLGVEFVSGYDIFNVASSLSSPKWLRDKLEPSPLSFLAADYQTLYENTTRFDRVLARIFWILFLVSGLMLILLLVLDTLGFLD